MKKATTPLTRDEQEALAEYMIGTPVNADRAYRHVLNQHRWGYHAAPVLHPGCPACRYRNQMEVF